MVDIIKFTLVHQVPSLDSFNVEQDNIGRTSKTSQKENGATIL
jgi:hypothetical protein